MSKLSERDIELKLRELPEWERCGDEIRRLIVFGSFIDGIAFVNRVADAAEKADHHPDIDIRYRKVLFRLSTHSEGGLTDKDFILAREINILLSAIQQ